MNCLREIFAYLCCILTLCFFSIAVSAMEGPGHDEIGSSKCKSVSLHERDPKLPPRIITLSGLPGSGKSTLARALLVVFEQLGLKAAWYNQDEFGGSRDLFQAALAEMDGFDFVIVDRGNHDDKTRALAYDVRREFMQKRGLISDVSSHDFLISFPFDVSETLRARGVTRAGHHTLAATDFDKVVDLFAGLHKPVARNEPVSRAQRVCLEVDSTVSENLERCLHVILGSSFRETITESTLHEAIHVSMAYENIIEDMNIPHAGFDGLPKKGRPCSIDIKIKSECLGDIQNLFQRPSTSNIEVAAASEFDSAEESSFLPDNVLDNKDFPSKFYCTVKDTHGATDVKWFVEHWSAAKDLFGQTVNLSIQRIVWDTNAVAAILNLPEGLGRFVSAGSVPYITLAVAPGVKSPYVSQMMQVYSTSADMPCLDLSVPVILQGVFGAEYPVIAERQPHAKAGGRGYSPRGQNTAGGRGRGRSHDSVYVGGRGGARGYSGRGSGSSDLRAGKSGK